MKTLNNHLNSEVTKFHHNQSYFYFQSYCLFEYVFLFGEQMLNFYEKKDYLKYIFSHEYMYLKNEYILFQKSQWPDEFSTH